MSQFNAPRITTQATFFDGISSRRKFNVGEAIASLSPAASPLFHMLYKTKRIPCNDPDFKWTEHRPYWLQNKKGRIFATGNAIPAMAAGAGDGLEDGNRLQLTDYVDSFAGAYSAAIPNFIVPGTVIQVKVKSGTIEYHNYLVVSVAANSATSMYVNVVALQNSGEITLSTTTTNWGTVTQYHVIGNAHPEGGDIENAYQDDVEIRWGSCQIVKTLIDFSRTLKNMALQGGNEYKRVVIDKGLEHASELERMLLLGCRTAATGTPTLFQAPGSPVVIDGSPVRTSLSLSQVAANADTAGMGGAREFYVNPATYEYSDFILDMQTLFRFGSKQRYAFCSGTWISFFNLMAVSSNWIQMQQTENRFGIKVFQLVTAHGTLNLVEHPLLNTEYSDTMFVVDMNNVSLRVYEDTTYEPDVNIKRIDGQQDIYLSDMGLQVELPETLGVFYLTTTSL